MGAAERNRVGLMVPPPLWYALGLAAGWLFSLLCPAPLIPAVVRWTLGVCFFVAGLAFAVPAFVCFARAKTSMLPVVPTAALVESGPYRVTRNPMYVGLALTYVAIAVGTDWLWALVLLPIVLAIVQRAAIMPEERYLEKRFGTTYVAYQQRVRRWL